jgi:hypothetical protein
MIGLLIVSAQARVAIPKLYFADEQADMFALLDNLDRLLGSLTDEALSDEFEQIAHVLAVLRTINRKPSSN